MIESKSTHLETTSLIDSRVAPAQPEWLTARRADAANAFGQIGFPTRRDEEWRSTPIAPIVETPFSIAQPAEANSALVDSKRIPGAHELVFVNGYFMPQMSRLQQLPNGVVVETLEEAIKSQPEAAQHFGQYVKCDRHAFAALNTASIGTGGVFIKISRGAVVNQPIHLLFLSQPQSEATFSNPRILILAEAHCQATIIERYIGAEGAVYLTNAVTEVALADDAVIAHYKVQQESKAAFHMASMQVQLGRASNFASHSFGFGALIARNDVGAVLLGEGGEATLNGLFIAGGRQLMDNHTSIDHAVPHCPSHEMYKHILDGHARAVFNGKIFVRLDAQKTDAKQTNKTLLLSPTAQIDTKPQLEIFADDVRCTHGATIGQLQPEQLFYLQSRGIGKDQAQNLLIYAFAAANIHRIQVEALRDELDAIMLDERHIDRA